MQLVVSLTTPQHKPQYHNTPQDLGSVSTDPVLTDPGPSYTPTGPDLLAGQKCLYSGWLLLKANIRRSLTEYQKLLGKAQNSVTYCTVHKKGKKIHWLYKLHCPPDILIKEVSSPLFNQNLFFCMYSLLLEGPRRSRGVKPTPFTHVAIQLNSAEITHKYKAWTSSLS